MSIIPYKPIDSNDDAPVYSEYRCKRYPAKTSFFIEHQNFQANYAAGFVTAALVKGYFHLLDNQLSGFGLVLFVFIVYMVINVVTVIIMDTVMVRIVITPYGLGYSTHTKTPVKRDIGFLDKFISRVLPISNIHRLPSTRQTLNS